MHKLCGIIFCMHVFDIGLSLHSLWCYLSKCCCGDFTTISSTHLYACVWHCKEWSNVFQNIIDRFHSLHLACMIDSFWKVAHLVAMETWRTSKRSLSVVFWCSTGLLSLFAIYQLLMAAASTAVQFEQPVPDAKLFIPQFRSIIAVVSVVVMWFLSVSMFVTWAEFLVYLVVKVHGHVL